MLDTLIADPIKTPYEIACRKEDEIWFQNAIASVADNDKKRSILYHLYGLDNFPIKSMAELGRMFSITRERVRHIENNMLRKLRELCNRKVPTKIWLIINKKITLTNHP